MLFSMFVSYYLVRYGRKTYVLWTGCFLGLASLLSTIFALTYRSPFFWLYLPRSFSFPFFSEWAVSRHLGPVSYNIYLPGLKVVAISFQTVPLYAFTFFLAFMFFLAVNSAGAALGFWIGKQLVQTSLPRSLFDFLAKSVVLSWIGCFAVFWLVTLYDYRLMNSLVFYQFHAFCMNRFWIPAEIATAIYGIYKVFHFKNESNVLPT